MCVLEKSRNLYSSMNNEIIMQMLFVILKLSRSHIFKK